MGMNKKLIAILLANLFCASAVFAADGDDKFTLSGNVGGGLRYTDINTRDKGKAEEFRDLDSGALSIFDVKGRGGQYYLDAFGENLGRDDQYLRAKGGKYGIFKYDLYGNDIVHNFMLGPDHGRLPYSGLGTSSISAVLPVPNLPTPNINTWNTFDSRIKRRDLGAMFEFSNNSPWYARAEANEVSNKGIKVFATGQGTSPGNGFIDLPVPIDYKTRNWSLEGGYSDKVRQASLNYTHSTFSNNNELMRFTNGYFANATDTYTTPADNEQTKWGVTGVLRQLPMNSQLAGRYTYTRVTNSVPILTSFLNTAGSGALTASNPSSPAFNGNFQHKTASLSLTSQPTRGLDTRLYWNWYRKDNNSTRITFSGQAAGACGGTATTCITDLFSYKKSNPGLDIGYRFSPQNRLSGGIDYTDLDRNRDDFNNTKDKKYYLQWKNSSLDWLGARLRYQYLNRRSNFLEATSGANANDPEFLNRYVARFDASNLNQQLVKLVLDSSPRGNLDLGFEGIYKQNRYTDTVLGRTKDWRQEYYFSVGYGDPSLFRVTAFADVEYIWYDSYHRVISGVAGTPAVCTAGFPNCFNPLTAPNATNYNYQARNIDRNWALGVGADWPVKERLMLKGSAIYQQTQGSADFNVQNNVVAAFPITNYDNTRKITLNLKGTYKVDKHWDLAAGYAFERFRFSDITWDGYRYTIGTGTGASYLSGVYAFPNYNANIIYATASYKF